MITTTPKLITRQRMTRILALVQDATSKGRITVSDFYLGRMTVTMIFRLRQGVYLTYTRYRTALGETEQLMRVRIGHPTRTLYQTTRED